MSLLPVCPRDAIVRLPDQANVLLAASPWEGLEDGADPIVTTDSRSMGAIPDRSWMLCYILGAPSQ